MIRTAQTTYARQDKTSGQITQVDIIWVAKAMNQVHRVAALQGRLNAGQVLENTLARFAKNAKGF